jgi:hypothetical protein
MLVTSTLTKAPQSRLTVNEILPGAFRSHGRDGTHDARKHGPIANVCFVIGADAVAGGSVREI